MNKTIYSKDYKILVKKMRQSRIDAGLDQISVAKKLGKSQSYISKIESGQRRIDILQLKAFSIIYKKDLEFFLK